MLNRYLNFRTAGLAFVAYQIGSCIYEESGMVAMMRMRRALRNPDTNRIHMRLQEQEQRVLGQSLLPARVSMADVDGAPRRAVVLNGPEGSGRSTSLRQLALEAHAQGRPMALIDVGVLYQPGGTSALLEELHEAVDLPRGYFLFNVFRWDFLERNRIEDALEKLFKVTASLGAERPVLFIDGLDLHAHKPDRYDQGQMIWGKLVDSVSTYTRIASNAITVVAVGNFEVIGRLNKHEMAGVGIDLPDPEPAVLLPWLCTAMGSSLGQQQQNKDQQQGKDKEEDVEKKANRLLGAVGPRLGMLHDALRAIAINKKPADLDIDTFVARNQELAKFAYRDLIKESYARDDLAKLTDACMKGSELHVGKSYCYKVGKLQFHTLFHVKSDGMVVFQNQFAEAVCCRLSKS